MTHQPIESVQFINRQTLIEACAASVKEIRNWQHRRSAQLQREVGAAWALLHAGCDFNVLSVTNVMYTIAIEFEGFQSFEHGGNPEYLDTQEVSIRREPRHTDDWMPYPRLGSEGLTCDSIYTREILIDLCDRAIVQQENWGNRDSADAQKKVGSAWAMLQAGCDYQVCRSPEDSPCITDEETIWLVLSHPDEDYDEMTTAYLPTEVRLQRSQGKDWY